MKKIIILFIVIGFVLVGCSQEQMNEVRGCPDAEISWVDVLMINDIKYEGGDRSLSEMETLEKGEKIGQVKYKLAGNACFDHKTKNGDAAFLPVGTDIYELVGYDSEFRVVANNKVYQVSENKKAKSISDLLDIRGKVAKLSLESEYDGSHISDFTEQETTKFIEDFLSLDYLGFSKVYKEIDSNQKVFLRIHLKDGSSFRIVYWLEENALNVGAFGTEEMKNIVLNKKDN
ncbi:hypothetical protein E3U55_16970 [Filobacillus milosensis]|uniref:Lipoprotein n=1 Tax=Filobacillus milosensis TaxID=94137 RepID=A0A4Y8ICM3_9BACI|nr:hypothetical protein [Filobacillus milosensis]TFB12836.1 hypothetical protein E3U55_16970 [Filobacillus milosensis]